MELGMATVVAITVIVYIIGLGIRAIQLDSKWIPVICGCVGVILGLGALAMGMPDFPAADYLTAAAVGGASGLAATGADQLVKQLKK